MEWNDHNHENIAKEILKSVDWKPTVQMLEDGNHGMAVTKHFSKDVKKTGQVIIQVRDVQGASGGIGQDDNPFDWDTVCQYWKRVVEDAQKDLSTKLC